jgi:Protein of unknown function (DUF2934)
MEETMASRRTPEIINPADPKLAQPASAQRPTRSANPPTLAPARLAVTADARRGLIAEGAYLRAERRAFAPGHETEDWLAAEAEVDALLRAEHGGSPQ